MNNLIVSLLSELSSLGIQLTQEQGKLKLKAPEGAVTEELKNKILKHKGDIISLLKHQQTGFAKLDKIPRRTSNQELTLSNAQRKLWLIDMLEGTSIHYNMPGILKLEGVLEVDTLHRALETIIQRHEVLRTVIRVDDSGKPYQHIYDNFDFKLPCADLTHLGEQEQRDEVLRYHVEDINKPFDLSKDLMFRAELLKLNEHSHIFLFDIHHISADGWSFEVFYKELGALYLAYSTGQANPLPELPIQFADYALWMDAKLKNNELDSQMAFWEEHLADMPAVHKLPLDKVRPEVQTLNGKKYGRAFDSDFYKQLKQFAEQRNVSLFMLFQSAFAALLSHWSGESDIVMATPNANRARPELASLIGFFTNTLVLRTQCDLGQTFTELLANSKDTLQKTYENQLIQFDMLVEKLNPPRVMAHNALAQITFSLESTKTGPADALSSSILKTLPAIDEEQSPKEIPSKFDLEFYIWELKNGYKFEWTYNSDLFELETIQAFDRDFEQCLLGILKNPDVPVHQLFSLQAEQKEKIAQLNREHVAYPQSETLFDMLENQFEETPDDIAVIFGESSLTYRQLHEKANRLAHSLRQNDDIQPGQLVGLYAERSIEMIIGLLAIIKAGGAYLPLDPSLPKQRLDYMLTDAKLSLVLAQSSLLEEITLTEVKVREIVADEAYPDTALANTTSSDLPIYAIYTSGSTGQPKGAVNSNRGLCNKLRSIQQQYSLASGESMLQKTPSHFDVSVVEIFWPLTTGGTTVLAEPEAHKDPQRLYQLIRANNINVVHFVPSMLRLFLKEVENGNLSSLRLLFSGGEELSYDLQLQAINAFPGVELVNQYGPTEAAIDVTYWRFNTPRPDKKVPIGYPLPNVQLHILNEWLQPVPAGVSGELFIGGPQVGIGYLNNDKLTNEKFISVEINGNSERVYRTGDKVRWLKDGTLEYLGRLDEQVKLRGFRIELGEIESGLLKVKGVKSAAAMIRETEPGVAHSAILVAYITTTEEQISDAEIKSELKKHLSEYMIPAAIIRLPSLPLTPSGKLNKRALPAPDFAQEQEKIVLPINDSEEQVLEIFQELLNRERVCTTSDFFELGGHSLLATELRMKLQQRLNVDVPLRTIFEKPTVKELSSWLENTGSASISVIEAVPKEQWVPSFAQQSLWFVSQFEGGSKYNMHDSFSVTGKLDITALESAFTALVERHSVFRQIFPVVEGMPKLALLESYSPLTVVSLEHLKGDEQAEALEKLSKEHALYPFDVGSDALMRAQLVILGHDKYRLMHTLHHLVGDGQSFSVFMRDLTCLYNAACGKELSLPNMSIQYGDYAAWQQSNASTEEISKQKEYWLEQLKGAPELLSLPTDYPRPPEMSFRGETLTLEIPESLVAPLETFSRKYDCTLFMSLLTGFKALMSIYSGESDICIGTAVNNRNHHQLKDLIGMFVNTLVLRSHISLEEGLSGAVKHVRQTALEAFSNQDLPFEQLVKEINPSRSLSHNALYQVAFQLEQESTSLEQEMNTGLNGLEMSKEIVADDISKYDLSLYVLDSGNKLTCNWEYATDLFKRETIERMHAHFCCLLESALENPDIALGRLLQPSEEELITLERWSKNSISFDESATLVDLLDAQLQKTPDNIALIYEEETISYRELHQWSNRYSHYLKSNCGVLPGQKVGVYAERSIEMVVSLLAILKAGAAYIPLDPNLPIQRLQYMVSDSQLTLITSQPQLSKNLADMDLNVVLINGANDYADNTPIVNVDTQQPAYGIYTSGSTGHPKCALNSHKGICNKLRGIQSQFKLQVGERILHKTPANFDVSVVEIFWPLTVGATSVLAAQDSHKDPAQLLQLLMDKCINVVHFVPSMLRLFIDQMGEQRLDNLRLLFSGGEALSYDLQKQTIAAFPDTELVNQYGPTEAAVDVTAWCFNELRDDLKVPIGKPCPNVELHVLDQWGTHVPMGISGELYIGGPQVGLGYLNRDDLTEHSFITRKVGKYYQRLYKTGDKVRWLADGHLEYQGRLDDQVKLRGFRIELAEIEHHLNQHSVIDSSLVEIKTNEVNESQLVAYIKLYDESYKQNSEFDHGRAIQALKASLSEVLPSYMVPDIYLQVEQWPTTFNGKIDKRALPSVEMMMQHEEYVAPGTDAELKMVEIWSQLLGIKAEQISTTANFFELGGHSLLSIQLLSEIRKTFDIEIALQQLFTLNTVKELAQFCDMLNIEKTLSSSFSQSDEVNEFEF
ncbi:hypothetical protein N480_21630 [Pseudoalteromonas luteoviolacea S2607]|uniref:non-ribosomal peptide synthetase n=1 Tax=Pseudoalteromonas luteoviolacea TaxID=43657 RepID=UPI0007B08A94|nr:non-ribosomal peptide synthetase [Pseudoalteromonas luteoviolacea]KZN34207.1 hypothetical protein N480_21630 [Pseudoalteromonas luteoviolacea S2607]